MTKSTLPLPPPKIPTWRVFITDWVAEHRPTYVSSSSESEAAEASAGGTTAVARGLSAARLLDIGRLAAEICKYLQQLPTMPSSDKKERAMQMARYAFDFLGLPLDEGLMGDLIDTIIVAFHHWEAVEQAAQEAAECCCRCFGRGGAATQPVPVPTTPDLPLPKTRGLRDHLNAAELIRSTYESWCQGRSSQGEDLVLDDATRAQMVHNMLVLFRTYQFELPDEAVVGEMLDTFVAIRQGYFALSQNALLVEAAKKGRACLGHSCA